MAKIMTNQELIARMKELLNEPNYYGSGGSNWSSWVNGGWYVDCTCSIKAILWGGRFIQANRGKAHAGCNYGSNGVPDFTPASCVKWTNATRGEFNKVVPGEILLMTSHGHAGLYIGNGQVIEVTPAWTGGKPGCQISQLGKNGERVKNGKQVLTWEFHGKIPVVDYTNPEPTPTPTPTPSTDFNIGDEVILNGPIYVSSDAKNPANYIYNKRTKVTRTNGIIHKYNTTGDLGWCDGSSLTKVTPGATYKTVGNCYWLNLRTTPSYGNNIYKAVPKGTKVEYLGMESGWAKIKYDNRTLYCGSSYLV